MKILIGLAIIILIVSCKKDRSVLTDFNNELMGSWQVQANHIEYYNEEGGVAYQTTLEASNAAGQIVFMEGLSARIHTKDGQALNTKYDAGIENDVLYLGFSDATIFEAGVWQVTAHTASEMTWKAVYTDIQYENEQGTLVRAPKAELTLKLKK